MHRYLLLLVLLVFAFLQILCPFNETWDDAFISLQYARNIARGFGPVFHAKTAQPVEGYSNPLWTFLLAAYFCFPGSVFVWIKITNLVAIAGLVIAGRRLLISVIENPPIVLTYLPGVLIVLDWSFFVYYTSGLETIAYAALMLGSLAHISLVVKRSETRGLFLNATMWLGVALLRPEGILYAASPAALLTIRARLLSRWKDLAQWTLTLAGGFSGFLLWRYSYYGDLLPNTYYAKVAIPAASLRKGASYYLSGLNDGLSPAILALAVVGLVLIGRRNLFVLSLLVLTIGVNAFFVVFVGGDFFHMYRFLQPTFVISYVAAVVPLIVCSMSIASPHKRLLAGLGMVIFATSLQPVPYKLRPGAELRSTHSWSRLLKEAASSNLATPERSVGEWLRDSLPPDAVIAAGQCGQIPYFSELETVDIVGLNDRYLARNPLTYDYLERRGVTAVVLVLIPSPAGPSTVAKGLVADTRFQTDFALTHRLSGQNQHGNTVSFAVFKPRDADALQAGVERPKSVPLLHELLADPSVVEMTF